MKRILGGLILCCTLAVGTAIGYQIRPSRRAGDYVPPDAPVIGPVVPPGPTPGPTPPVPPKPTPVPPGGYEPPDEPVVGPPVTPPVNPPITPPVPTPVPPKPTPPDMQAVLERLDKMERRLDQIRALSWVTVVPYLRMHPNDIGAQCTAHAYESREIPDNQPQTSARTSR